MTNAVARAIPIAPGSLKNNEVYPPREGVGLERECRPPALGA